MDERKMRVEEGCRNAKSVDGTFGPTIRPETAARLTRYCRFKNINRTRFVEQCINDRLDVLEREYYESLTREELIDLVLDKHGGAGTA